MVTVRSGVSPGEQCFPWLLAGVMMTRGDACALGLEVPMSGSPSMSGQPRGGHVTVDATRLWGGGLATALVAALVAVVGVLIAQDVFNVNLVRPAVLLDLADRFMADYAITAFLLGLVATAIAHGLALTTPRPRLFFTWIIGLATVVGAVTPFAVGSDLKSQVSTAAINLVLGIAVISLLRGVMARTVISATRPSRPPTSAL
jgi:hypothetical protein